MNYLIQINSFWDLEEREELSPTAIAIYFSLLHLNNRSGWKTVMRIQLPEVMHLALVGNVKTFYNHFNKLKKVGLIQVEPAKNQFKPTQLTIRKLGELRALERKNKEKHSDSKDLSGFKALSKRYPQKSDNQTPYNNTKKENIKTDETKNENGFSLNELETSFLSEYETFIFKRTQIPFKAENGDLKSLRNVVRLMNSGNHNDCIIAWKKLLNGWGKLSSYFQSKITLEQIEKNLIPLLNQIKNNHESSPQNHTNRKQDEKSRVKRKDFKF